MCTADASTICAYIVFLDDDEGGSKSPKISDGLCLTAAHSVTREQGVAIGVRVAGEMHRMRDEISYSCLTAVE